MSDNRSAIEQAQADVERLTRERDEARDKYQWMVEHAAAQKLDGYRALGAKCAELERERDEAQRERDEARAVLRHVEWLNPDGDIEQWCPWCIRLRSRGHAPDCAIARALGEEQQS